MARAPGAGQVPDLARIAKVRQRASQGSWLSLKMEVEVGISLRQNSPEEIALTGRLALCLARRVLRLACLGP